MAELAENPSVLYLSTVPTSNGNISGEGMSARPESHSLYQLQINPDNPNQAALLPAPKGDAQLVANYSTVLTPAYQTGVGAPKPGQEFIHVEKPTMVEKVGDNWKITEMGRARFSDAPAPALNVFGAGKAEAVDQVQQPAQTPQAPQQTEAHRFKLVWNQQNGEGAPLEEIARYAQSKGMELENGIQVKRRENGQLNGELRFKYDPAQVPATTADGIINALKLIGQGNGMRVYENPEQETARNNSIYSSEDRISATVARNDLTREIRPGREWVQDDKHLLPFMAPSEAPAIANEVVAQQRQAAPAPAQVAEPAQVQMKPDAPVAEQVTADVPKQSVAPAPTVADEAKPGVVGELQVKWTQQGDGVAPLMEMRAYIDQLKDSGVAVGALKLERGQDGKLAGSFGVSYDPASAELTKLEGTIQGLKRVGNGIEVSENAEQVATRRRTIGVEGQDQATDLGYSVKEAFGPKQWDSLSAQLSQAPKHALTAPEQMQQAAGVERVKQVAQQQGKTNEQVVQDGKSLLDIDTSGNPVSAFLKNFYDHLTGGPKTRQTLEVDYEKTRQELQTRLLKSAGNAQAQEPGQEVKQAPQGQAKADDLANSPKLVDPRTIPVTKISAEEMQQHINAANAQKSAAAKAPTLFQEGDVPQKVLATMGLTVADLVASGQMQKLLNGEKTDLLSMQVAGQPGHEPVKFEGKMVLHREDNGTATLKMELPKRQLEIPNEIGGQPFTPEQRQKLESDGNAGLIRGLKDEKGQEYNGYVAVDKTMNKVVILPENKVKFEEVIAGVKLSPEQSHDLKEGKAVPLANMVTSDGGRKFDGTAQVNAAKASIEIKPAAHELQQHQAPQVVQSVKEAAPAVKVVAPKVETPKPKRGPRL